MTQFTLKATTRDILGKKVKQLRARGITPVHLYGHGIPSQALQVETAALERLLARASTSHLIDLTVDGSGPVKVLVREVQRNPLNDRLLHVDFFQVRMEEEIEVEVPVNLVGEPAAKWLIVEQVLHQLSIRCLPGNIPPGVEVDISHLAEPGQAITVADLNLGPGISVLHDTEEVVVRVEAPTAAEEEVPAAEEAAAEEAPAPAAEEAGGED